MKLRRQRLIRIKRGEPSILYKKKLNKLSLLLQKCNALTKKLQAEKNLCNV
jgi:hypothetical protein